MAFAPFSDARYGRKASKPRTRGTFRRCGWRLPARALEDAGYGSLWHGQRSHHRVAILAKGERPVEVKGLVVASVYLPNGNPQPGPKFDYKLAWFERFNARARALMDSGRPVALAGDLNVVSTKIDICIPTSAPPRSG